MSVDREDTTFHVVVNAEGHHSIWPAFRAIPAGWTATGVSGDRKSCLAHIDRVWSDMRPRGMREAMDRRAAT